MSLVIRDFVETDDIYLTAFARYLGYRVVRCATPLEQGCATFGLLVPANDWEIVQKEFMDPETTLTNIQKYADACKLCNSMIRKSRANGGVYGESLVTRN